MAKRRRLRGKKLLVVSGAIVGASAFGSCGGDDTVANLIAPPPMDATLQDATADAREEMDSSSLEDATTDANEMVDAEEMMDSTVDTGRDVTVVPFDGPVANLLPPPDVGTDEDGGDDA